MDAEKKRLRTLLKFEKKARAEGFNRIAGIDEAGRGPLAGPVVAAACVIPEGVTFPSIDDSKRLTPEEREKLFQDLTANPDVDYGVGVVDHLVIDAINIFQATVRAMLDAILKLKVPPDLLLIDGMQILHPAIPCWKIIKGDQKSQSIAAASIIAKVTRDQLMVELDQHWPDYGFKKHKGYCTEEHLEALNRLGPCPIHRKSFSPVAIKDASQLLLNI